MKHLKSISEIDSLEDRTEFRLASCLCIQPCEYEVDEFKENINDKDANFVVTINKHSNKDLNAITDQALAEQLSGVLNYENMLYEEYSDLNNELVKNTLSNIKISDEGPYYHATNVEPKSVSLIGSKP